jgi:Peptidase family M41
MVREFGLSDKIGPVSYSGPPGGHPGFAPTRSYSEHTQWLVDQEVAAILAQAETQARNLLTRHRQALDRLTAALLEQETVSGDQVRALVQASSPVPMPTGTPVSLPAGTLATLSAGPSASRSRPDRRMERPLQVSVALPREPRISTNRISR